MPSPTNDILAVAESDLGCLLLHADVSSEKERYISDAALVQDISSFRMRSSEISKSYKIPCCIIFVKKFSQTTEEFQKFYRS